MKVVVFQHSNYKNAQVDINAWFANHDVIFHELKQSSCYDPNINNVMITTTIIYKEKQ